MLESLIQQYNALDNTEVTRVFLTTFLKQLALVKNTTKEARFMHGKIQSILNEFTDDEFLIELSKKIKAIDVTELQGMGIPLYNRPVKDVALGLNGKINAVDIYQMITDKMIALIEEATGHGYQKKWQETINEFMYPVNFVSKKPYRGINHALLTIFGMQSFENPYFLTFKQIEKLKGKIKKGSKSHEVVYFTKLFVFQQDVPKLKIGTYDVKRFVSYINKHKSKIKYFQEGGSLDSFIYKSTVPLLRYYRVFNGSDIEGIDFKLDEYRKEFAKTAKEKITTAEAIVKAYPKPNPPLKHGGDNAYYTPTNDFVQMPKLNDFDTKEDYYRTLFHEFIHSTGHKKRLDRFVPGAKFGNADYAKEELVAELGAVFLSAEAGIMWRNNSNHAEYIKNWKSALKHLKDDNKLIFRASSQAQKATDFILQRDENGIPKYLHGLLKTAKKKTPGITKKKTAGQKEVVGMYAPEIVVNLPPVKEVFLSLPPKQATIVAKPVATLQQNEKEEVVALSLVNTDVSEVIAENKRPLLQQNNNFATKNQQVATKPQQELYEPKKATRKQNKNVLSTSDINNMTFDTLPFTGEWASFMQEPAKTMKLAIWGKPKNGKTAGATKLANYLTNFGSILYNFADQGINKSTQDLWKLSGLHEKENAFLSEAREIKDLEKLCASGDYDFVFIDMINTYIHRTGMKPHEFEDRFIKKYPNISFILIFEVTKSGNFKGDQGWTHLPDALITVDSFVMHNQGRYGVGEYVVWEEGLRKVNPKKYKEYFGEEEEEKEIVIDL